MERVTKMEEKTYPTITDELIKALEKDFPNTLPKTFIDKYELGVLIGQQQVIEKLKIEKKFNEELNLIN